MHSDDMDFEELFRRISSSQTSEAFKALRYATTEDLASTFQPSLTESVRIEQNFGQLNIVKAIDIKK